MLCIIILHKLNIIRIMDIKIHFIIIFVIFYKMFGVDVYSNLLVLNNLFTTDKENNFQIFKIKW